MCITNCSIYFLPVYSMYMCEIATEFIATLTPRVPMFPVFTSYTVHNKNENG